MEGDRRGREDAGERTALLIRAALVAAAAAAAAAVLVAILRELDAVTVRGRSMMPTLLPGDRMLVRRLRRPPRVGELVLAPDPREGRRELVKRVAAVDSTGVALRGDNPSDSTDGRSFGNLLPAEITWRVVARYWPLRG